MVNNFKTWFITGASRGIGLAIAQAAHDAGDNVVATARNPKILSSVLPASDTVLHLPLDVTDTTQSEAAVAVAMSRFGRIDVLVNNAGYGQLGIFEEIEHESIARQFDVNVFGLMHVTRTILPAMRAQNDGQIFNISSIGGALGFDIASIYCATKFAVEGFSECLALELAPFNIGVTIVEPGFFRTDFLDATSVKFADTLISDYADYAQASQSAYAANNHKQLGNPALLGAALVALTHGKDAPLRFVAGSDALKYLSNAYTLRQTELVKWEQLTRSTDFSK